LGKRRGLASVEERGGMGHLRHITTERMRKRIKDGERLSETGATGVSNQPKQTGSGEEGESYYDGKEKDYNCIL